MTEKRQYRATVFESKRSFMQLAELKYKNGVIVIDRDAPVTSALKK